tara:strand:- start:7684 stop:8040 length:357 start_codon:yes stop_codon:yes gene_type:complete
MRKKAISMNKLKQTLVFLLGLFVAVFVVAQEVLEIPCEESTEKQEQAEGEDSQEVVYEYTCDALLPASGVHIEPFEAILIAEIGFEITEEPHPLVSVPLCNSPYYKTLFRQIISPNAP